MTTSPRVSIGLPVYNGARHVRQTLESLLSQTYSDFELIISDNGSTDETPAICAEFAARDPRIRYHRYEQNRGAAWNYNHVFALASGEYFKWAAHDDLIAPTFLEQCVAALDRDPALVLCYARTRFIDDAGQDDGDYEINGQLTAGSDDPVARFSDVLYPWHGCFQVFGLIRSRVLARTPLIGSFWSSDRVLLAWLSLFGRFHELDEHLFMFRRHIRQSTAIVWRPYALMAWYAPEAQGKITLPFWMEWFAYFDAVRAVPLSLRERLICYGMLLVLPKRNHRIKLMLRDVAVATALSIARPVLHRSHARFTGA